MRAGLVMLCLAYVLSQFFRAFLAVLTTALGSDLGARAEDLAAASGFWFLAFAAMQLPVGWALDRIGPRRTASVLLLLGGGGGSALFAMAGSPDHLGVAMLLIGIGCSPVLMASYYIFARQFPVAQFATLAAVMLGVGSIGNLVASYPMALTVELIGWRPALWSLSGLSVAVALGIWAAVKDPPPLEGEIKGSVLQLLRMPVIWAILPLMFVNYAPSGAIRGLWIGPYLSDVYGLNNVQIGQATLVMGLAMILGTFLYGPLDRILQTRKWVVFTGNLVASIILGILTLWTDLWVVAAIGLMAVLGIFGASFPVVIAHGRSFFPPHLVGRGVTLMNLFGIGGVGLMQFASGRLHASMSEVSATAPYTAIFGFFGLALFLGTAIYAFSRDSLD